MFHPMVRFFNVFMTYYLVYHHYEIIFWVQTSARQCMRCGNKYLDLDLDLDLVQYCHLRMNFVIKTTTTTTTTNKQNYHH